jgi:hypothetical protein
MKKIFVLLALTVIALDVVSVGAGVNAKAAQATAAADAAANVPAIEWSTVDRNSNADVPLMDWKMSCNMDDCSGCCDINSNCQAGTADNACGYNGDPCVNCGSAGQYCVATQPGAPPAYNCESSWYQCNPSCNTGCCDVNGHCHAGTENYYCGNSGSCVNCTGQGLVCYDGYCNYGLCTPGSCPTGCCDTLRQTCSSGTADDACGTNGEVCQTCPSGKKCIDNQCQTPCTPALCPSGCCSGISCIFFSGQNESECGAGGAQCANCGSGAACESTADGGQCVCDTTTCTSGCCSGAQCLPGNDPTECGADGAACVNCGSGSTCPAGVCVDDDDDNDDNDDNDDDNDDGDDNDTADDDDDDNDNDDNDTADDDDDDNDDNDASPDDDTADDDVSPDDDDDNDTADDDTSPAHPGGGSSNNNKGGCGC